MKTSVPANDGRCLSKGVSKYQDCDSAVHGHYGSDMVATDWWHDNGHYCSQQNLDSRLCAPRHSHTAWSGDWYTAPNIEQHVGISDLESLKSVLNDVNQYLDPPETEHWVTKCFAILDQLEKMEVE